MTDLNKNRKLNICDLGFIDYKEAWDMQKQILALRSEKKIDDIFLLLEHPNTYTLGKVADRSHLVGTEDYLKDNKISVYDIDRGGDITYHGPGQIVGYPLIDLNDWHLDTHKYLRSLEEVIIKTCAHFGLTGTRDPKYTGVWIENRKIAAIGIKVSRWITMHGFAFNVNTDLSLFNGIIPCGIHDKEVTSLNKELNKEFDIQEIKEILFRNFKEVYGYSTVNRMRKEILNSSLLPLEI